MRRLGKAKSGKREKGFGGIGKKMLIIFTFLLGFFGMGLSVFFGYVFGKGYSHLTEAYLSDVTEQTINNLEKMIADIEENTVEILIAPVIQESLDYTNKHDLNSYAVRNINQRVGAELENLYLYDPNIVSISIVSKSGVVYTLTSIDGRPIDYACTEKEIYEANGTTLWRLGESGNICVAKAILDLRTMKPLGYMNIVYNRRYFQRIVYDNATEYSSEVYVVDENGTILISNREEFVDSTYPVPLEELTEYHGYHYDRLVGQKAFFYVGDVMPNQWILVETVSVSEYRKSFNQIMKIAVLFLGLIFALGFMAIRVVTRYIARPTQDLVESMKQFGKGNLSHRVEVTTRDEIGQIAGEYNRMANNIENLIEQVYMMEITQKQSEIDFLRMQINPHFLYNTLDTISWMALSNGNEDISEITIVLADLLRAMVKSEQFITVKEEMHTVREYLFIQEQRFEDKISAKYEVDEEAYPFYIPNFILQPLIENAIIHGLEPKVGPGTLHIRIHLKGQSLEFDVEDDGAGMTEEEIEELYGKCRENNTGKSIGLKNVYRRLILCYGEESKLTITSEKNVGTKISFTIPAQKKKESLQPAQQFENMEIL